MGKITGHGVTPTGVVIDIDTLVHQNKHATVNNPHDTFNVRCRSFKVTCEFENSLVSKFIYTVSDVK